MTARPMLFGVALVAAVIGLGFSVYAYLTPATGVDDTAGPLLTALGHAAMAAGAAILLVTSRLAGLLVALGVLAALLTAFAGYLLLQPAIWGAALAAGALFLLGQTIGAAG